MKRPFFSLKFRSQVECTLRNIDTISLTRTMFSSGSGESLCRQKVRPSPKDQNSDQLRKDYFVTQKKQQQQQRKPRPYLSPQRGITIERSIIKISKSQD